MYVAYVGWRGRKGSSVVKFFNAGDATVLPQMGEKYSAVKT